MGADTTNIALKGTGGAGRQEFSTLTFQVFDQTYIMTEGGPAYATLTMSYYIYLNAFQYFHMGRAAALAYILFIVVFVITVLQFRLQRRWVFYQ